jgi:hypothetical protein
MQVAAFSHAGEMRVNYRTRMSTARMLLQGTPAQPLPAQRRRIRPIPFAHNGEDCASAARGIVYGVVLGIVMWAVMLLGAWLLFF